MKNALKNAVLVGVCAYITHQLTLQAERKRLKAIADKRLESLINRVRSRRQSVSPAQQVDRR